MPKPKPIRPSEAVFADGRKPKPLAILPEAIGASYPTRTTEDIATVTDRIAVLCIEGPLEHKDGGWWSYWQTYEELATEFKCLCDDPEVRAIVMKFDSPGGEVAGLIETVGILQEMKETSGKPVIAYVDEACYSAAYALAMVADEIYLPESGGVGSIGVITAMADCTEADKRAGYRIEVIASGSKKTDGHPHVALTEGAINRTRKLVNKLADSFFEIVSASRGLSVKEIAGFQAGIFTGQEAVEAGLADGVMSLADCLTVTSEQFRSKDTHPRVIKDPTEPQAMPGQLAAAKALNDAQAAMTAAKTDAERALCAARIVAAEETLAKVKKTKTTDKTVHTEEVDDGEDDDKKDDAADDSDDEDAESAEDASSDEDDEKASAMSGLLQLARRITGKKSIEEVMGALHGMHDSHKKTSKLAAEVAALRAEREQEKVAALIASGLKAGKLAPSQRGWAKTQTAASLRAYLEAAPKLVHTNDEEHTEAKVEGAGKGGVSAEMAKIWLKQGFTEKDFPMLVEKLNGASKTNGAH